MYDCFLVRISKLSSRFLKKIRYCLQINQNDCTLLLIYLYNNDFKRETLDFHDIFHRSKLRMHFTQEMSITLFRLSRKVVVDIGEKRVEFALSAFRKHVSVFLLKTAVYFVQAHIDFKCFFSWQALRENNKIKAYMTDVFLQCQGLRINYHLLVGML